MSNTKPNITKKLLPNILNLHKLDVFHQDVGGDIFNVDGIGDYLSSGRTYFSLSYKNSSQYKLKSQSKILWEVIDSADRVVYSDVAKTYTTISGMVFGYIDIRENIERLNWKIQNGSAILSIVGELEGSSIPNKWENVYNVRYQKHFTIRKDTPNNSPIMFQETPTFAIGESVEVDSDNTELTTGYKRSYILLETDKISTYGGKIKFIDVLLKDDVSRTDKYKKIESYELEDGFENIRNPLSSGSEWVGNFHVPGQHLSESHLQDWVSSSTSPPSFFTSSVLSSGLLMQSGSTYMYYYSNRKTVDVEDYQLKYHISGTATVQVHELSGSRTDEHKDTRSIYKRTFTDYNPSSSHGPLVNGRVSSSIGDYYVLDDITIQNNKYYRISVETSASQAHIKHVSFKFNHIKGQNPPYYVHKFPLPSSERRNRNIDFKLNYANNVGQYAKHFNSERNFESTVLSTPVIGSPFILETTDNFVKPNGAIVFGGSITDGVHMFPGTDAEGKQTIKFDLIKDNIKEKTVLTVGQNVKTDEDTNTLTKASGSAILAASNSTITLSDLASIVGGTTNIIEKSENSSIYGGANNKIIQGGIGGANTIMGVGGGRILSSSYGADVISSVIVGGLNGQIYAYGNGNGTIYYNVIVGGSGARIVDSINSAVIGGSANYINQFPYTNTYQNSVIVGGTSNRIINNNAVIMGMQSKTSDRDNSVFVQNLSISGDITSSGAFLANGGLTVHGDISASGIIKAQEFHTTYTSASIIYQSGSSKFGDTADDIHSFTGSLSLSGSYKTLLSEHRFEGDISASGDLYLTDSKQIKMTEDSDVNIGFSTAGLLLQGNDDDSVIVNNDFKNTDFKVFGESETTLIYTDASTDKVGIGDTGNPPKTLTVAGDISGSGNLFIVGNISGSTTSTGSFGKLVSVTSASIIRLDATDIGATGTGSFGRLVSTSSGSFSRLDATDMDISNTGSFGRLEADSYNITSALTSLTVTGNISGSATSTGSFGQIVVDGAGDALLTIDGDISASGVIKTGNSISASRTLWVGSSTNYISASLGNITATGTGSFGKIESVISASITRLDSTNISATGKVVVTGEISSSTNITAQATGSFQKGLVVGVGAAAGDLTGSGVHNQKGRFVVNYGNSSAVSGGLQSVGDGYGEITTLGRYQPNATIIAGCVMTFSTGSDWHGAAGDSSLTGYSTSISSSLLGVSMGVGIEEGILLKGFVKVTNNDISDSKPGQPVYLGIHGSGRPCSKDDVDATLTATGDIIRVVGYVLDPANGIIHFNPSSTWIEIA